MRLLHSRLLSLGLWMMTVGFTWSQTPPTPPTMSPLDGTTPGINTPGSPAGVYHLSSVDTVNHANGHLNIRIPLAQAFGRGDAAAALSMSVESHWQVQTISYQFNCPACQIGTAYRSTNETGGVHRP